MKRLVAKGRVSLPRDTLQLLVGLAEEENVHLSESRALGSFGDIERLLEQAKNPIRMYGRRVEEMFEYVTAELALVKALKREDVGTILAEEEQEIAVPDYRILFDGGTEIFVEVKNCHNSSPSKPV